MKGSADNTQDQSVETLWQAGAWDQLEGAEDPLLRAASQAMLTAPDLAGPGSTLAERQTLLDESASTRTLAWPRHASRHSPSATQQH